MSISFNQSAQPTIGRVIELLDEVKKLDLSLPDRDKPLKDQKQQYEIKKRIVKDKIKRFELYVGTLETINQKWLDLIQQANKPTKKEEEGKYEGMVNDKQGILHMINNCKETITTLNSYYEDLESAFQQEKSMVIKEKEKEIVKPSSVCHSTINLPQLPLPTFSGDLKLWREFWNSFNAAIHLQEIPNIQKLTYLISCLKGEALEAIRGFEVAPENYELMRQVLIDKYGKSAAIKKSLYDEFYSIQRNDKEWKKGIEAMEKILRQLEALGENLEHSSIEVMIENRLPPWILDKVYQMKTEKEIWTVNNLRKFLMTLILRNEEVNRNQISRQEPNLRKEFHYQRGKGTSALFITKQSEAGNLQSSNKRKFSVGKRPCIFCNKNHWNNECPNYLTVKKRFERLKELKACTNCFRMNHATSNCKQKKRICFHCKGEHNTALCYKKYGSIDNGVNKREANSTIITNSLNQSINHEGRKVLLICKEIEAVNPNQLEIQEEALVLFDPGSQSSFVSKKLANRLGLTETTKEELKLFSFGNQFPKPYQTSKVEVGMKTLEPKVISINAYVSDYLTEKLQIITPISYDINYITRKKQLDESGGYQVSWPWKDSKINLQDNYGLCYGRLRTLIKRLRTNPSLLERYDEIIKEQLQSNIIEKVTTNMDQEDIIHYLPHHEVLTPGKATTKLQIVYDASAHITEKKV
uniref:DUF1758 domain-containing protein n=1 Tax=Loa loa TaxID=7209 RepID=A0A1I7VXR4_LOALO